MPLTLEIPGSTIEWEQEERGDVEIVVPEQRGRIDDSSLFCYHLFRDSRPGALFRTSLAWDEEQSPDAIRVDIPERIAEPGTGARDLAGMSATTPSIQRTEQWVAWLDDTEVHAAIEFYGLQHFRLALPFRPGRIVRNVVPSGTGGCLVLVESSEGRELACIEFHPPIPETDGDTDDLELDADEPEDLEDPLFEETETEVEDEGPLYPVRLEEPRILWTERLEQAVGGCALAVGVGPYASLRGITMAVANPRGVELRYQIFNDGAAPGGFDSITIADAVLLPDSRPAMVIDGDGRAHVALLVRMCDRSSDGNDLAIGRVSFDLDGHAILDRQTMFQEVDRLPGEPVAAAISIYSNEQGHPAIIDWCVLLDENRLLVSSRRHVGATLLAPAVTITRPLMLLSMATHCFIAACTEESAITFLACG